MAEGVRRERTDGGGDVLGQHLALEERPLRVERAELLLRNAAATPASTGTWRPVVWLNSAEVIAVTALATCSGSTSRLSNVRWA